MSRAVNRKRASQPHRAREHVLGRKRERPGRETPQKVVTFRAVRPPPPRGSLQKKAARVQPGIPPGARWMPSKRAKVRERK